MNFSKLLDPEKALIIREELQKANKLYVFTNGCFDILHPGHLDYLASARALGDYLLVGLNGDASIRRLKGPVRPVNSEEDRAIMLSGLFMVDGVVIFSEDTPLELINYLNPDILVKGGDWGVDKIVGGKETIARGGKVISLPFVKGYSTSSLIKRIVDLEAENS
ncbi:MAG: D-glycero-beta-D-manno-heptose 1-phosphate adenylyltransferase [Deltaproteobacteria bacterium]|jgi:rfaE bifunctional protein nucleotidyltransferase chain/domain|nr:D-glycero-beta-D-manno-heptose 1-phosphate adenylyltransferase [Deltaproteobacteria bacterium]